MTLKLANAVCSGAAEIDEAAIDAGDSAIAVATDSDAFPRTASIGVTFDGFKPITSDIRDQPDVAMTATGGDHKNHPWLYQRRIIKRSFTQHHTNLRRLSRLVPQL
jgi:hypothetical protein